MRFNSVLISSFFASAVLVESEVLSPWAGVVFEPSDPGHVRYVAGTFNVPDISHAGIDTSAFAFVGIGGTGICDNYMLHLGVKLAVTGHGHWYSVAYRYGYDNPKIFFDATDVPISTNDTIKLTVNAPFSGKLGIVKAENLSNNKSHTHEINLAGAPCGRAAVWVVEEDEDPSENFGPFTFFNTEVGGSEIWNRDEKLININIDGTNVTKVDVVALDAFEITW